MRRFLQLPAVQRMLGLVPEAPQGRQLAIGWWIEAWTAADDHHLFYCKCEPEARQGVSPKGLVVFRWWPNVSWNQTERSSSRNIWPQGCCCWCYFLDCWGFLLFDVLGVFGVVLIGLFLACLALLLLGCFWRIWRYIDGAYFLLDWMAFQQAVSKFGVRRFPWFREGVSRVGGFNRCY